MATGAPGTNGVWQYGEDDSEATFSALLNKAASTTDTQIGADRTRLTALEARKLSGQVPLIPSSVAVTGGSGSFNSTTGLVTFTGVSAIALNGIFTSSYTNYRIVINCGIGASVNGEMRFRYRSSGTDLSTASYNLAGQINSTNGSTSQYNSAGLTYTGIFTNATTVIADSYYGCVIEMRNPAEAKYKNFTSAAAHYNPATGMSHMYTSCHNTTASAFDGFNMYLSASGSFTGTLKVYGYN